MSRPVQLDYMDRVIQALQEVCAYVDWQLPPHTVQVLMFLVEGKCTFGESDWHGQNLVSALCYTSVAAGTTEGDVHACLAKCNHCIC